MSRIITPTQPTASQPAKNGLSRVGRTEGMAIAEAAKKEAQATHDQQETRAKSTWNADPKIRTEFGAFETYLAYTKAQDAGRIKSAGRRAP